MSKSDTLKNKGTFLTQLRQSNAAGIHDHRRTRSEINRDAIEESLLEGGDVTIDADWPDREPTEEELDEIDAEDYDPQGDPFDNYDDEDEYPYDRDGDYEFV